MSWFMNHEVTHKSRGRLICMSVPEFGEHAVVTWEIEETARYIGPYLWVGDVGHLASSYFLFRSIPIQAHKPTC